MRAAFIGRLMQLAEEREDIVLVTGDLGFGVLEEFERRFPTRFINAGVAEQNMTALATGMALEGYVVFTYSIGNFPTLRCLEQIRNDACYHRAKVRIVSIGGGFSYGQLGMSHHATEDLSIMRALPEILVCAPSSPFEVKHVLNAIVDHEGPAYLRLERASADYRDDESVAFAFGRARMLRDGADVTMIVSGGVVAEVVMAADELLGSGVTSRVLSFHSLKPLDVDAIHAASAQTGGIVTIEENSVLGGLGGAVAEICLEHHVRPRFFRRLGISDKYVSVVGDQAYLRGATGLDYQSIARSVRDLLSRPAAST